MLVMTRFSMRTRTATHSPATLSIIACMGSAATSCLLQFHCICNDRVVKSGPVISPGGVDGLWSMYQRLDLAPGGRKEAGVWWRRHDEYESLPQGAGSCCQAGDPPA